MLILSFGEVELKAPETPQYLRIALELLRSRLEEVEGASAGPPGSPRPGTGDRAPVPVETTQREPPPPRRPSPPEAGGRVRWFRTHLPRVVLRDGTVRTFHTVEELRRFVAEMGLTPHRRGDASILVWQVRHRLGLPVDEVPLGGAG